jgi:hypothetical protein
MQTEPNQHVSLRSTTLMVVLFLAACGHPTSQSAAHANADPDMQKMLLIGYDLDIASEGKGLPVQPADKSWTDHWLTILSVLGSVDEVPHP